MNKTASSQVDEQNVVLFVDIHGHSINDNIFMYGWKGGKPEITTEIKEIPYLLDQDLYQKSKDKICRNRRNIMACEKCALNKCSIHTNLGNDTRIFNISNCKFSIEKSKENTGRVCIFKELGIKQWYTLEASYFRAIPEVSKLENPKTVPISPSIKYRGYLINNDIIDINEKTLIEFGKYFAHSVTFYYNQK